MSSNSPSGGTKEIIFSAWYLPTLTQGWKTTLSTGLSFRPSLRSGMPLSMHFMASRPCTSARSTVPSEATSTLTSSTTSR